MAEPLLAKAFAICYTEYWKHIVFCKKGGGSMNEEKDMRMLIEEDLRHSQEIWESYSHDKEKLGELFQLLLQQMQQPYQRTQLCFFSCTPDKTF